MTPNTSSDLARHLATGFGLTANLDLILCPSAESLAVVSNEISETSIKLGAQDVFGQIIWKKNVVVTGGISVKSLVEIGVEHCLIGHSERREYFGENDEVIREKFALLVKNNITPILCVGEMVEELASGNRETIIVEQIESVISGQTGELIVAYEPRFAIGQAEAVDAQTIKEIPELVRNIVLKSAGSDGNKTNLKAILYGGSVNAQNAKSFIDVGFDGLLVGRASTNVDSLLAIKDSIL